MGLAFWVSDLGKAWQDLLGPLQGYGILSLRGSCWGAHSKVVMSLDRPWWQEPELHESKLLKGGSMEDYTGDCFWDYWEAY